MSNLYAHILDGNIKQGPRTLPRSWRNVSGLHHLAKSPEGRERLRSLGWLPVEKNEPGHDPELEYLVPSGLEVREDRVVWNFAVRARETGEVFEVEDFDAWHPFVEVEGGMILRGARAVYRTKQDVLNDLKLRPAEAKAYLRVLLDECMHWVETGKLGYLDPGLYDATHRIKRVRGEEWEWRKADGFWLRGVKKLASWFGADGGEVERFQYELQEDPEARLFKLGFTRKEAQELV